MSKVSTPELTEVPEQDWQEARRRLAIIQPLSATKDRTRDSVTLAARHLRLSVTHAYRLLKRYDADPRLTSLLPFPRGPKQGKSRLQPLVEDVFVPAIIYLIGRKDARWVHGAWYLPAGRAAVSIHLPR